MSFSTLGTTESADSTANNGENGDFTPLPVTGRYKSLQALHRLVKDAIGAHPHISMNDSDVVAVEWADAIEARLYKQDGCLGELQGDAPYTTDEYENTFGETVGTPHEDLTRDERTELKELFRNSENHDVGDAKGEFKLPVINDERLPVLVADDDVLAEGIELLDAMMDEVSNDARSTTSDVEYPILEGTIPELETWLDSKDPVPDKCEQMLEAEKAGKDRKGAKAALNEFLPSEDEGSTTDEDEDEESDDEDTDTSSTTSDGMSEEEKAELAEKVATAAATAVVEALDN